MFDLEKAFYCAQEMKNYFANNKDDAEVPVPQDVSFGSEEHIIYLFYSCLLDYGMRSKIYHTNLINTYKVHKEIFDPKYVTQKYINNEEELLKIVKDYIHPRYPRVALKKWLSLSKYLNDNYSDNNLLWKIQSLSSYKELYNFITSISGYGQKTGGLLLRLIHESGVCTFEDDIQDIPIDRHDVEISYLNGVINKEKLNDKELKVLGSIWIKAAKNANITASDIDKYLWTIGATLCIKRKCDECPLKFNCKKK